ncbi:amino acid ABC transporter substrate-binding protein (PAAT family) [Lachnotalea glycerini]|jgi:polar amino acid transport system substrate-binding protein|uniref:ABC transporter substrate-binding protein n=1 Tax=Lachnotalea glycerini TaxID=1763509 RepID=A0A255IIM5_9FIRM|nr:amino acid ABC transporter substrate-binding protein [Lachnotalea glycerini]PXV91589.1 amino acid ABC transporter substrate-binding protein (PAAT family) [Lachnotalea glycerini]RDY30031.1 ABC transporter substrate-binding protein [Lachnotalea glycerini]
MKKIVAVILSVGMIFSMTACGNSSKETKDSASSNTLTVGFDQDFPPFGYVGDDGEFTGFDIELATECAKRMGKEISLQPIDWDAKDMELESGTIDCIWNGFTINGREDDYTWSKPYMDNSQVFIVKADSGITSFADLAGKVVEVQKESSAQTALEDENHTDLLASFGQFLTVDQYNTAFMDLESGAVNAIGIDIGVAKYQLQGKEDKFTVLEEQISSEQYGIGFLKGNEELRDEVEAALMEMVKDGTFAKISDKYFGYDVCILGE